MPPSRKYSDPDAIAQITDLTLRSRRLVEGAIILKVKGKSYRAPQTGAADTKQD